MAVKVGSARIDETEEWPEWIPPTSTQTAYDIGDKVTHNNGHWISNIEINIWAPGIYGWTRKEEYF